MVDGVEQDMMLLGFLDNRKANQRSFVQIKKLTRFVNSNLLRRRDLSVTG